MLLRFPSLPARTTPPSARSATACTTLLLLASALTSAIPAEAQEDDRPLAGNVIFIHPDGAGVAGWGAARALHAGPDGELAWDALPHVGIYRGHQYDAVGTSSNAGATAHAFGVKVPLSSYGTFGEDPLVALSGAPASVMTEAIRAGYATALVNSGHIAEPGTGVFAASNASRDSTDAITSDLLAAGVEVILSGGEMLLLPAGVVGRHGVAGVRADGRNLIEEAEAAGYEVVYDRDELMALDPTGVDRLLGVFAAEHTFHDDTEEGLRASGRPTWNPGAPTVGEMTLMALRILEAKGRRFFLVTEEEGSDNFANDNHATGTLEALIRADEAIAVARDFLRRRPATLLITASDSDAGGMELVPLDAGTTLVGPGEDGEVYDGVDGPGTPVFMTAPDRNGRRHPFAIGWAGGDDMLGGIAARAEGLNGHLLPASVDNTDVYRMMWATLFGRWPEDARAERGSGDG